VLDVERLEDTWPEQESRQRRWVHVDEAAELVREDGLAAILRAFSRASA
jgi:hypothetical protein